MSAESHPIPELDRKGLRDFGLVTGAIIAVLFGLFFPWIFDRGFPIWPWIVFAVLGVWGLVAPNLLRPVYYWWMRFGLLLSKFTTPIIMGAIFYVIIMPVGLGMRLARRDPLARAFDASKKSYRVESLPSPRENLEKPF